MYISYKNGTRVIIKQLLEEDYGGYLWPSALVLTSYLLERNFLFQGKRVLELGAGVGLPGLFLSKNGANVVFSDSSKFPAILANLEAILVMNQVPVQILPMEWGSAVEEPFDLIIGADLFYDSKLFEDLIVTLSQLLQCSPHAQCLTAYHERSAKRNIYHLLEKWNLTATLVDFAPPLMETVFDIDTDTLDLCSVYLFSIRYQSG